MKCIIPTIDPIPEGTEFKIYINDWRRNGLERFGASYTHGQEITGTEKDLCRIMAELISLGLNVQVTRLGHDYEDKKKRKEHKNIFYSHVPSTTVGYEIGVDYYRFQVM